MPYKVLVCGMGAAGLSSAYWLKHYGHDVTLVEKSPTLRTGGYKIDIRGVANQVLAEMGLRDQLFAARTRYAHRHFVDAAGNIINTLSGDEMGFRIDGDFEVFRGELSQQLYQHYCNCFNDVSCRFNDTVTKIRQGQDEVEVTFEQGDVQRFDIVVGADGLHSSVRQLAFMPREYRLVGLDIYLSIFSLPNFLKVSESEWVLTDNGNEVLYYSASQTDDARVAFVFSSQEDVSGKDKLAQFDLIRRVFAAAQWEVPRFFEYMADAEDFYFDAITQVYMRYYSKGRVVLVGDAGYCASPMSGQGTSLALVGGYVLAQELAQYPGNPIQAFSRYHERMEPFVKANQALATEDLGQFLEGLTEAETLAQRIQHVSEAANAIVL